MEKRTEGHGQDREGCRWGQEVEEAGSFLGGKMGLKKTLGLEGTERNRRMS